MNKVEQFKQLNKKEQILKKKYNKLLVDKLNSISPEDYKFVSDEIENIKEKIDEIKIKKEEIE